ncbi:hypothetical protein [Rickettsia felis]|nr:hypothetical protein [Rickettsia felis]
MLRYRHCKENYIVIRRSNLRIFDEIATQVLRLLAMTGIQFT